MSAQAQALTPSELVYFHGERFASKVLLGNVKLVASGTSVSAQQLGQAVLATAFLALDRAGVALLEVRSEKRLLGLASREVIYVVPTATATAVSPTATATARPPAWPTPSLEAALHDLAVKGAAQQRHRVAAMIYDLMQQDRVNPWQTLLEEIVPAQLAARGWLIATEVRKLKIFVQTHYECPPATAAHLARQSSEEAALLLAAGERERPREWKLLIAAIKSGMKQRTEQSDSDD
jgi:hypothetical protein